MKKLHFIILFFLSFYLTKAQTSIELKALDTYFQNALKEWNVPGMAIAIVSKDSVLFSKGYGFANIEKQTKVDGNTLFAVASNSKAFTATSIAKLVENKQLNWNDKVIDFLPYFKMYNDYVTNHFTITDLLSHHSGLATFSGDLLWYGTSLKPKEIISKQQYLKPIYEFRTHFGYSNIAFLTAGKVLEKITNTSWQNYVKENFLIPLKMNRTLTSTKQLNSASNVATPYYLKDGKNIALKWVNWDNIAPAGGLISSANDFGKWIQLNLNKGIINGKQFYSKSSFIKLTTPQTNFTVGKNNQNIHFKAYALGWDVQDYQGVKVISHSGGYDGMISKSFFVPEKNFGAVILTNSLNWLPSALTNKILDVFLTHKLNDTNWALNYLKYKTKRDSISKQKDLKEEALREKINPNHLDFKYYVGKFQDKIYGSVTVSIKNGKLSFQMDNTPIYHAQLNHWNGSIFTFNFPEHLSSLPKGKLWFDTNKNGKIIKLHIDVPNPDFDFTEFEFVKQENTN